VGKYGTDYAGFGAFNGNVNNDAGAALISSSTDGSSSFIFDVIPLREIIAGIANGDFTMNPNDSTTAISDSNKLPYFSTSDSSSGRIALTVAASTAAPGTSVLRYTITSGLNADSFYVEKIIPIVSSEARSFNYQVRAAVAAATSNANYAFKISAQYLQIDGTTTTGTEGSTSTLGTTLNSTISSLGFSYEVYADVNGGKPAPADAHYLRIRYTVTLTGSVTSATIDLSEVRVERGVQVLMFADQASPDTYGYGQIAMNTGIMSVQPNAIAANRSNPTIKLDSVSGDSSIDSSLRTAGSITITNIVQDGPSTTIYGSNPFQVGDVVPISGVTPSYFNSTGGITVATRTSSAFTTTSYTTAFSKAVSAIGVYNGFAYTNIRLTTGSFTNGDFGSSGQPLSYIYTADTTVKISNGLRGNQSPTTGYVELTGWERCWSITSATTGGIANRMTITAPGHNVTTADKVWVTRGKMTGTGEANIAADLGGGTAATVLSVSGNDITYSCSGVGSTATFTKDPLYDWSVWAVPNAAGAGTAYRNTVYTSGGTASAQYPLSGNVTLTHSGNTGKSVIVASGLVSGAAATSSNLRFLSTTGPQITGGGTNTRLMSTTGFDLAASTSTTSSGVLITKPTAGQPSTNLNGSATTDAFSDALRNGGLAVDTTNNRGYFYSSGWKYAALTTPSDSRLKEQITSITGALDKLKQLIPVAFKWKRPEAHGRTEAVDDDGERLGFIADQVATTDLKYWVETLGVDDRETDLVDTPEVLAVNIPQNEMEALVVQALIDIDTRLKALEER